MDFCDLTIHGDYSDYKSFGEEKETISKNDEFWIKPKKWIWGGRVLFIPYIKKEDSENLKI